MSFSHATDEEASAAAIEPGPRRAVVRRVDLVRSALGAVRAATTLSTDTRTSAALTALEDAAAALLLQHRPDLCPAPKEPTP